MNNFLVENVVAASFFTHLRFIHISLRQQEKTASGPGKTRCDPVKTGRHPVLTGRHLLFLPMGCFYCDGLSVNRHRESWQKAGSEKLTGFGSELRRVPTAVVILQYLFYPFQAGYIRSHRPLQQPGVSVPPPPYNVSDGLP